MWPTLQLASRSSATQTVCRTDSRVNRTYRRDVMVDADAVQLAPPLAGAELGWSLSTVLRAYIRSAEPSLGDLPGGARGFRLLSSVARDQLPSQLALAQRVGLDRTVVTYLLDDLAAAGLLERRSDPIDRRTRRVVITRAGVDLLAELGHRLHILQEEVILASLDEADRTQLRALLNRVAHDIASGAPATCREDAAAIGVVRECTDPNPLDS